MTVSFIHAADLHIDSPLRGLPDYEGAPLDDVRGATRRAFSTLIDIALERRVDFVVLAGDVWDGDWPDIGTGLFFIQETARLGREGIPIFVLRGNHDAESRITKAITFPDWIKIFDADGPQSFELEDLGVVLHGQSFARPDVEENIALGYPDAHPERINIGVLHTALEGYAQHRSYAPCTLDHLRSKKYDYWALGHVHEHEILAQAGAAEGGTIVFPGVLQGRQVRETGPKGALYVEIGEHGTHLEQIIVDVVRWHALDVNIAGAETIEDVARAIGAALREMVSGKDTLALDCLMATRLTLSGPTPLHGRLRLEHQAVRDEAIAQAAAIGSSSVYIEKVCLSTVPMETAAPDDDSRDALAEIQAFMGEAGKYPEVVKEILDGIRAFLAQLPPDARGELEELRPQVFAALEGDTVEPILPDATQAIIDYLARS